MGAFSFVLRVAVFTVLLAFAMQVRWEGATLEQRAVQFLNQSTASGTIESTAKNAVKFGQDVWAKILNVIDTRSGNRPGQRHSFFEAKRSQKYQQEQENKKDE